MGINWGGFASGLAGGYALGSKIADDLEAAKKKKQIDDVRAQGVAEAKAARDAAVEGAVQEAKAPPAASVGITGKPAETVTTGSSQPTDSVIPNPENATGATVTPVTSPTDSPDAASAKTAASGMVNVSDNQPAPAQGNKADPTLGVLYVAGKPGSNSTKGMVEMGNIDLNNRPVVKNPDGSVSTVRSMSINVDGKEVLIPTVVGGKVVSDKEAIDHFKKTGEHLGMFESPEAATAYADVLHKQQEQTYAPPASKAPAGQQPGQAASPAAGGLPFVVNGKGYATRAEALAAADKATPDMMTFIGKTMVPRLQQTYMEQGDIEKADAWGKWAEDKKNQAAMKQWAGAYRAAQIGDYEKAADHVFELYKNYDDGITPVSKETVKDKDGNITGFNVKLKVDATGEERTQFIDRKNLTEMGLSALSPPQMFELQYKRQVEADKMAAAAAADNSKSNRDFKEKVALQDRKHDQDLEKLTIEKQLDASNASSKVKREVGAKVQALRDAGYSEDFINGLLPGIIGVGEYKKQTSPEEARRLAFSDRVKSDPMFGRKSPEEQQKILDGDMKLIYGGVKPSSVPPSAAPPAPASGLPPPSAAPAGKKGGVPVYDTKTGQIIYR